MPRTSKQVHLQSHLRRSGFVSYRRDLTTSRKNSGRRPGRVEFGYRLLHVTAWSLRLGRAVERVPRRVGTYLPRHSLFGNEADSKAVATARPKAATKLLPASRSNDSRRPARSSGGRRATRVRRTVEWTGESSSVCSSGALLRRDRSDPSRHSGFVGCRCACRVLHSQERLPLCVRVLASAFQLSPADRLRETAERRVHELSVHLPSPTEYRWPGAQH